VKCENGNGCFQPKVCPWAQTCAWATDAKAGERREPTRSLRIVYRNWRGETSDRNILPVEGGVRFGTSEWHKTPQWLMAAHDLDKGGVVREFAVVDIQSIEPGV